jgi:hypothetical protein
VTLGANWHEIIVACYYFNASLIGSLHPEDELTNTYVLEKHQYEINSKIEKITLQGLASCLDVMSQQSTTIETE